MRGDEALGNLAALLHLALETLPELGAAAGMPAAAGAEVGLPALSLIAHRPQSECTLIFIGLHSHSHSPSPAHKR